MNKYAINKEYQSSQREVEAESFATDGDFIDFTVWNEARGVSEVVLRVRAARVETIELVQR